MPSSPPARKRVLLVLELEVDAGILASRMPALASAVRYPGGLGALTQAPPERALYEAAFNTRNPTAFGVEVVSYGVRPGSFDLPDTVPQGPPLEGGFRTHPSGVPVDAGRVDAGRVEAGPAAGQAGRGGFRGLLDRVLDPH